MHKNDSSFHHDGQAVLQRLHSDEVPSTWRVIRASRKKLITLISGFCTFVGLLVGFLTIYLFTHSTSFFRVPRNVFYEETFYGLLMVLLFFVLLTILVSLMTWITTRNIVLVLLPEGFVRGDSMRRKNVLYIHYQNVREMYLDGSVVMLAPEGAKWQKKWIDCRLFEDSPQEVASCLLQAYENFKAHHGH